MSDEHQRKVETKDRIARNEAIFREINERVLEVRGDELPTTDFLCECGNLDCTESVALSRDEYERVRSDSSLFFIVPGHLIPAVESVVGRTDRFHTVSKHPGERGITEATDPRR